MLEVERDLTVSLTEGAEISNETAAGVFSVKENGDLKIVGPEKGKKPVLKGAGEDSGSANVIKNLGGKLDVSNVKVEGYSGVYIRNAEETNLTNVEIDTSTGKNGYGLGANAAESQSGIGEVNLKNCTIKAHNTALGVYLPTEGDVIIDGGSITGGTAVEVRSANLTLTGDLTLEGKDTRSSDGKRVSKLIEEHNFYTGSYCNGSALILITQDSYANGKNVTVTIENDVKFNPNNQNCKIEIVGVGNANDGSKGANLVIDYEKLTNDELATDNYSAEKPYLLDIAEGCKKSIKINGEEKNTNIGD